MESFNAIATPVASAAKHLTDALRTARHDFAGQSAKTRRAVSRDIAGARDDLSDAAVHLAQTFEDALTTMRESSKPYRESAMLAAGKGGDYFKSLVARANALLNDATPTKRKTISRWLRNPYLLAGTAAGIGYLVIRTLRQRRAPSTRANSAQPPKSQAAGRNGKAKASSAAANRPRARKRVQPDLAAGNAIPSTTH